MEVNARNLSICFWRWIRLSCGEPAWAHIRQLSKLLNVDQIPRSTGSNLVLYQVFSGDHKGCGIPFDHRRMRDCQASSKVTPSIFCWISIRLGGTPICSPVLASCRSLTVRPCSGAPYSACLKNRRAVVRIGADEQVEVFGRAGLCVYTKGKAADDQIEGAD